MASTKRELIGQAINSRAALNAVLLEAQEKDVVHIDEAHELTKKMQTALYTAIDKREIVVDCGIGPRSIPVADFTLLVSTTDEYCLLKPLRDRMRLVLRFEFYAENELAELLVVRTNSLHWDVDHDVILEIAKRSQGIPRLSLRLLKACRCVCRADGDTKITSAQLRKSMQFSGNRRARSRSALPPVSQCCQ